MDDRDKQPKKIVVNLDEFYIQDKTLDDVLDLLHRYRWDHKGFERLFFDVYLSEDEWGQPDQTIVYLKGERKETPVELGIRINETLGREDRERNKMRQEYENLKRFFDMEK